jgi:xanthine dehydrogenase iron-sulfur cluster and FAD-binding subunit A
MSEPMNTHILAHEFSYHEPATLDEARALLLAHDAKVIAGGTDVLVHMKMERGAPAHLVSLRRVPELCGITADERGLTAGAMTTISQMASHPLVRSHFAALAEACDSFSTTQVATMGTLGGNIANASPAADAAPALLAYDAEVVIHGPGSSRRLPLGEFFVGPGKSALERGEIVTAVALPRPTTNEPTNRRVTSGSAFLKMGRVAADIAKASAAVVLTRDGGCIGEARLAFGSVGPTPLRTPRAEALLRGQPFTEELIAQAAELAAEEISPIDDVRSQAWYRREIVRVMALDGLQRAWRRAGQPGREWVGPGGNQGEATPPRQGATLEAGQERAVTLRVNGETRRVWVQANELLLNVLRDKLQLTGSKYGCGIGECSACTVLLDGKPVLACLVLAVAAEGHVIQTVEGLQAPDGTLDPLQETFIDLAAYQCGYCTPGMLMTAKSLLAENPHPTEDDVRHYLRGNLCRCTGYVSIARAVLAAANGAGEYDPDLVRQLRGDDASRI